MIAEKLPNKNQDTVFLIESKFSQYTNSKQEGGPLTGEYLRALFDDFAKKIRDQLPNAIITLDVSVPMNVEDFKKW